jgi:hypothetical protein
MSIVGLFISTFGFEWLSSAAEHEAPRQRARGLLSFTSRSADSCAPS